MKLIFVSTPSAFNTLCCDNNLNSLNSFNDDLKLLFSDAESNNLLAIFGVLLVITEFKYDDDGTDDVLVDDDEEEDEDDEDAGPRFVLFVLFGLLEILLL